MHQPPVIRRALKCLSRMRVLWTKQFHWMQTILWVLQVNNTKGLVLHQYKLRQLSVPDRTMGVRPTAAYLTYTAGKADRRVKLAARFRSSSNE
jgi:hypothetical protein